MGVSLKNIRYMKKLLRIVSGFFLVGGIVSLVSCNNAGTNAGQNQSSSGNKVVSGEVMPIAYIDTDSLLRAYEYAVHLQEELLKKEEKSRTDFNEQAKKYQGQMTEFQRKLQNNGFLSRDRAEQEQRRLLQKEQELQSLNTKLSNELMQEQENLNRQLRDTLTTFLEIYNADGRYQLILSNTLGDNVLYSAKGVNITNEIIDALNARYSATKK